MKIASLWLGVGLLATMGLEGCGDHRGSVVFEGAAGEGGATEQETCMDGCLPWEACHDGECRPLVCTPNRRFCSDGEVHRCSADGTSSDDVESCGDGSFCVQHDGDAECRAQACTPGKPFCQDRLRGTCREDGSGPEGELVECDLGEACRGGACEPIVCSPFTRSCEDGVVSSCNSSGTELRQSYTCSESEACDATSADCLPVLCEPGTNVCVDDTVMPCNASGTGWGAPLQRCGEYEQCSEGACRSQRCAPYQEVCVDGDVHRCDWRGFSTTLERDCGSTQHCEQDYEHPAESLCVDNVCVPNERFCGSDDEVWECDSLGQFTRQVRFCDEDEVCDKGSCVERACQGELSCNDAKSKIVRCNSSGFGWTMEARCDWRSERCAQSEAGKAACVHWACEPGALVCRANQIGACAEDASGVGIASKDCAAQGQVCLDVQGCASSAVDTMAEPDTVFEGADGIFIGNSVTVTSDRKLTEIEVKLTLPGARSLRWLVLEQRPNGDELVFERVTESVEGGGYHSSGNLEGHLLSWKTYLIGVVVTGGEFQADVDSRLSSRQLSFGETELPFSGESPQIYYVAKGYFPFRITTALN